MINNKYCPENIRRKKYEEEKLKLDKKAMSIAGDQIDFADLNKISARPASPENSNHVFLFDKALDLSIIVPVYNNQIYVKKCITSALLQKTQYSLEIIAVDDGSTDHSGAILDELSAFHTSLKVIHQENRGHSGARNRGLEVARGKYITFLDSDDFLPRGAVEKLLQPAIRDDADIVGSGYWRCDQAGRKRRYVGLPNSNFTRSSNPIKLSGFPWGSVYKRELWENVRFPEGYWFEDTIIPYLIISRASKIQSVSGSSYNYRTNSNGITSVSSYQKKGLDSFWVTLEMLERVRELGIEFNQRLFEQTLHQFGPLLYNRTSALGAEERSMLFQACCSVMCQLEKLYCFRDPMDFWLRELREAFRLGRHRQWVLICEAR